MKYLKGRTYLDKNAPGIVLYIAKSNKCFNSDRVDRQFSNDMGRPQTGGLNKTGFMGDYTLLEEMDDQIRVISSIINSCGDFGLGLQRCYIVGYDIIIEFYAN